MSDSVNAPESRPHPFDALATIGCVYLALCTFGFAAFRYLNALPVGAKRNQDLTFFDSINIVSLSGFAQSNAAIRDYPTLGLVLVAALALMSTLTTLIGGGYLFARVTRWRISIKTLALVSAVIVFAPLAAGFAIGGFNAISASTGLGLWSRPHFGPIGEALAIGLSAVGCLGVLPLMELIRPPRSTDRDPHRYIASTCISVAAFAVIGIFVLRVCGTPWEQAATRSLALRSFGNAGAPALGASPAMPWMVMLLSLVGSAPASSAGGLSVLPIVIAVRGAIDTLRGRRVDALLGVALAWIATFAAAIFIFVIALATLAPALPAERSLMLVASAMSNTGISYEPVGVTGVSLFALSAAMLVGRLLPLLMLAWMAVVADKQSALFTTTR